MIPRHDTLCRRCGGKCCRKGQILTENELNQMSAIVGSSRVKEAKPKRIARSIFVFRETCPALTLRGCLLLPDQRPRSCQLYPFVERAGNLTLDLECEHWRVFGEDYKKVKSCLL